MKPAVFLFLFSFLYTSIQAQTTADILIKNGRILDGTGNSWIWGDIAIKDGKIIRIDKSISMAAAKTIDAKGPDSSAGLY